MFDRWTADPEVNAQVLAAHPIGRFSDPMEKAEAALFLLSQGESSSVLLAEELRVGSIK